MSEVHAGLDTSVLLRLLVGQPAEAYTAALRFMDAVERAGARLLVSNLVIAEAYYACQHHYGVPNQEVLSGLHTLLSLQTFVAHPAALDLLAQAGLARAKPGFLDRLIHAECAIRHPFGHLRKGLPQAFEGQMAGSRVTEKRGQGTGDRGQASNGVRESFCPMDLCSIQIIRLPRDSVWQGRVERKRRK